MPTTKFIFTRASLAALPSPAKGRLYRGDAQTRGLVLDIQASGTKSFQVYRKVNGKPTRITLGRFNPAMPESREVPAGTDLLALVGTSAELNVRMARRLADAVNASLDRGVDPAKEARLNRTQQSGELTLRAAFDTYFTEHLVPHGRKTAEDMRNDFARYLGKVPPGQKKPRGKEKCKSKGAVDWEQRKLSSIEQGDIRRMMIQLKEKIGGRTANKAFVLLRSLYNWVIAHGFYPGVNPCSNVEKFKENSRERFLTSEELPRFMAALNKSEHQDFKDFVFLALFTGARRENVLGMRWGDVDVGSGMWTIPGAQSKNDMPLTIPLTSATKALLAIRKEQAAGPYVFPAVSKSGHMSAPNKHWKKLLMEAELPGLRIHDLRRSLGSWAAMTGASLAIIGRALGHKSTDATAVYARLQHDPVMEAMERATAAMLEKAAATG
ncbi:tyrosine-type recombinase/integrase [Lacisediminimonas profundi]|uniref:tyrosine-type recombinase/integrase n=1 Tax=Lacisediminimonas profundi TaxID=2603856 RepID=UPI00124B5731|nr:site-specific integrase [Lacisediminimonas profundi]